jgi:hypothetical protein
MHYPKLSTPRIKLARGSLSFSMFKLFKPRILYKRAASLRLLDGNAHRCHSNLCEGPWVICGSKEGPDDLIEPWQPWHPVQYDSSSSYILPQLGFLFWQGLPAGISHRYVGLEQIQGLQLRIGWRRRWPITWRTHTHEPVKTASIKKSNTTAINRENTWKNNGQQVKPQKNGWSISF